MITSYEAMCRIDPVFHKKVEDIVAHVGTLIESSVEEQTRHPEARRAYDIDPFVTGISLPELKNYALRQAVDRRLRDLGWEISGGCMNLSVYVTIRNSPM